jgi:hypothetical protein
MSDTEERFKELAHVAAEVLAAIELSPRKRKSRMAELAETHLAMTVGTARWALMELEQLRRTS